MRVLLSLVAFLSLLLATTPATAARLASESPNTCVHDAHNDARAKSAQPPAKSYVGERTRVGPWLTGKEEDIELGLQYFGARYYSPNLGRFISPDPLTIHGAAGDINPYAYVRGRVYNEVDPFGLEGCDPATGLCGGGGSGMDMGHPGVGGPLEAIKRFFGGGGGGGGGGLPRSNAQSGYFGSSSVPFMPPPQYSLPPNIAAGVFQHTGVGQWVNAWQNPVQDRGEYFAGIGKGVALGACFWCVVGGGSAGYVPDEFYLVGATGDAQRGIADGFGLVGAASGLGEAAGISAPAGALANEGGQGLRLALGISRHPNHLSGGLLGRFALRIRGLTYWDFFEGHAPVRQIGERVLSLMEKAESIHFNLDGMIGAGRTPTQLLEWGAEGIGEGNVANWELFQAIQRFRGKTFLYLEGGQVVRPWDLGL